MSNLREFYKVDELKSEIAQLKQKVKELERPLWKREDCPIHVYQTTDEGQRCVNCHLIAGT